MKKRASKNVLVRPLILLVSPATTLQDRKKEKKRSGKNLHDLAFPSYPCNIYCQILTSRPDLLANVTLLFGLNGRGIAVLQNLKK